MEKHPKHSKSSKDDDIIREAEIEQNPIHGMKELDKVKDSICMIKGDIGKGTGFFVKIPHEGKLIYSLLTNFHVVSSQMVDNLSDIEINLYNGKTKKLNLNREKRIIFQRQKEDFTIIQILKKDFENSLQYLLVDSAYDNVGFNCYKNESVFVFQHPEGKTDDVYWATGSIVEVDANGYSFSHNASTSHGSSGSPVVLGRNLKVAGLHFGAKKSEKLNKATFLGAIIEIWEKEGKPTNKEKDLSSSMSMTEKEEKTVKGNKPREKRSSSAYKKTNPKEQRSYSTSKKKISSTSNGLESTTTNIVKPLIPFSTVQSPSTCNYYEASYLIPSQTTQKIFSDDFKGLTKDNCKLFVDGKEIEFTKTYDFKKEGKVRIRIEMKDKKNIYDMKAMFNGTCILSFHCSLDMTHVRDMSSVFYCCSGIKYINLEKATINKVEKIAWLFRNCKELNTIKLGNLKTNNITSLNGVFKGCESLTKIDLTNLNTDKVTDMRGLFSWCKALEEIIFGEFNTSLVTDMGGMFKGCEKLTSLDLSTFDTQNVKDFSEMFKGCSSLKKLITSNKFIIKGTANIKDMNKP